MESPFQDLSPSAKNPFFDAWKSNSEKLVEWFQLHSLVSFHPHFFFWALLHLEDHGGNHAVLNLRSIWGPLSAKSVLQPFASFSIDSLLLPHHYYELGYMVHLSSDVWTKHKTLFWQLVERVQLLCLGAHICCTSHQCPQVPVVFAWDLAGREGFTLWLLVPSSTHVPGSTLGKGRGGNRCWAPSSQVFLPLLRESVLGCGTGSLLSWSSMTILTSQIVLAAPNVLAWPVIFLP